MLKRRTGIFLLTILFITGLAGTITDNTIKKTERKTAVNQMKDSYDNVLNVITGLSETQLNFKPAPDKWSIQDCMFHIAATEKLLWTIFEETMKTPANPEKRIAIKLTDEEVLNMIENRSFKATAPESLQPKNTGFNSLNDVLSDFKTNRMDHIKYMKNTTEDLRNHVVQLPIGWIDCYQLYLYIAGHSNRHTQQINEIRFNAGLLPN